MARFFSALLWIFISLLILAPLTLWAALALWFRFPGPEWVRAGVAGLFVLLGLATAVTLFTRLRLKGVTTYALAFVVVGLWFSTIMPPIDGDWAPEVARQTTATLNGDILTLSDVREFEWQSNEKFDERWSKRSYDLSKLNTLDLFLAYWAGPEMAHLIMTFGFDNGDKLAWSVEVRPEKNSEFSPIADAFKSHTLVYLATSERDSVRLRSNIRNEDVRLFRINTTPENARILLLAIRRRSQRARQRARMVQFDHHQLHDRRRQADPRGGRVRHAAARLAASRQRLSAKLPLRPQRGRDVGPVGQTDSAGEDQRARPRRRPVARLLPPHPRRRAVPARGRGREVGAGLRARASI